MNCLASVWYFFFFFISWDEFFCKWNLCQDIVSGPFISLFSLFPLFLESKDRRTQKKKKDLWVRAKGLHILNKKVSLRYSQDKLRMVILSILVGTIFSPEPRTRAEALTLVLLCSVCFGGTKAAKCRLIFPSWRWLEKWVKIQKLLLHTHTPLGTYIHKGIHR